MSKRAIVVAASLCVLLAIFLGTFVPPAYAVEAPAETGLSSVFKKREATGVGPTKTQFAITIGATIVMIAVVKYL